MRLANRLALACLAALVAGCIGNTPQTVRAEGAQISQALTLPPERAAGCMARNAEAYVDTFTAAVRALPQPGHYELIVRQDMGGAQTTMAVSDLSPQGTGSAAQVWTVLSIDSQRQEFLAQLIKGC